MKTLTTLFAAFLLSAGFAAAQDMNGLAMTSVHAGGSNDLTGFHTTYGPDYNPNAIKSMPNPHVVLTPKIGGVFVDGVKYGTIMISPGAPAEYGMGERYLSAPSTRFDLQHESGPAAHRDTGGLKLFTFEF